MGRRITAARRDLADSPAYNYKTNQRFNDIVNYVKRHVKQYGKLPSNTELMQRFDANEGEITRAVLEHEKIFGPTRVSAGQTSSNLPALSRKQAIIDELIKNSEKEGKEVTLKDIADKLQVTEYEAIQQYHNYLKAINRE